MLLSDSKLLLETVRRDENINLLRQLNPTLFDATVAHPSFIGDLRVGLRSPEYGTDDIVPLSEPTGLSSTGLSSTGLSSTGLSGTGFGMTNEDYSNLTEVSKIVPHALAEDIIQIYIACGKDKDATVNFLLSNYQ